MIAELRYPAGLLTSAPVRTGSSGTSHAAALGPRWTSGGVRALRGRACSFWLGHATHTPRPMSVTTKPRPSTPPEPLPAALAAVLAAKGGTIGYQPVNDVARSRRSRLAHRSRAAEVPGRPHLRARAGARSYPRSTSTNRRRSDIAFAGGGEASRCRRHGRGSRATAVASRRSQPRPGEARLPRRAPESRARQVDRSFRGPADRQRRRMHRGGRADPAFRGLAVPPAAGARRGRARGHRDGGVGHDASRTRVSSRRTAGAGSAVILKVGWRMRKHGSRRDLREPALDRLRDRRRARGAMGALPQGTSRLPLRRGSVAATPDSGGAFAGFVGRQRGIAGGSAASAARPAAAAERVERVRGGRAHSGRPQRVVSGRLQLDDGKSGGINA